MKNIKFSKVDILDSNLFDFLQKSILSSLLNDNKLYSLQDVSNILNKFLQKEI